MKQEAYTRNAVGLAFDTFKKDNDVEHLKEQILELFEIVSEM